MRQMHAASSLEKKEQVRAWAREVKLRPAPPVGKLLDLKPLPDAELPADTIEQVIPRRGSTRRFSRNAITFEQLSTLLVRGTRGIASDFSGPMGTRLNDLYLIVNNVEGLASGAYYLRREKQQLELLKEGEFRERAGYLGLEQQLPADASADIYFLADLQAIAETLGNRGYRAAHLEAGILGGKFYLGAYAQKLGATGLTFYDDDVVNFFSPHAKGKSAIFQVCLGHSATT